MLGAIGIISVAGIMYRDLYASDPGWVQPGSKMDIPTRPLCQYCMVRPPMRSRHCFLSGEGTILCTTLGAIHAGAVHEAFKGCAAADIVSSRAFQGRAWSSSTITVVSLHAGVGWQKLESFQGVVDDSSSACAVQCLLTASLWLHADLLSTPIGDLNHEVDITTAVVTHLWQWWSSIVRLQLR